MPRTRIRAKAPLVINTGGSQVVDSGNPAGSSLTVDSIGSIDVTAPESAAPPIEAQLFAATVLSQETNTAPDETEQFFAIMQGVGDTAAPPAEATNSILRIGATAVAASVTTGSGWTNPNNAAGLEDTVVATLTGPAALNPAQQTATLVLSYAAMSLPADAVLNQVIVFASLNVAALGGTGSLAMSVSTDGGANYGPATTVSATSAGPFFLTGTGVTATNTAAGNVRIRLLGNARGTTIAASTISVDAAHLVFTANT